MLKQIIAAVFLIAFSMQTFSRAVIAINFYANQKEIAQTLCENKDKPQMNCCGKCQLKKRLAENDKAEPKDQERKLDNKADEIYFNSSFADYNFSEELSEIKYNQLLFADPVDQAFSILRPPCA